MDRVRRESRGGRRAPLVLLILAALLFLTPIASMWFGAATVAPRDIIDVLRAHLSGAATSSATRITDAIIWQNRAPRVAAGLTVGAILGVCGVALQAMVRNPLAEPYVLGVSAGASLGAAAALVVFHLASELGVAGWAFAGALTATGIVLAAGGRSRHSALQLILAGLAVSFAFQSLSNLVVFASDSPETSRAVMFWMLGSLSRCTWTQVGALALVAVILSLSLTVAAPILDAVASGDGTALSVGLNPARVRLALTVVVSLAVALAVAAAGGIGFVGLVVPHLCRGLVGHAHRALVPAVAMASAVFLVWADTFARAAFSPAEVPIGIVTGLIGAPVLLLMVRTMGARA